MEIRYLGLNIRKKAPLGLSNLIPSNSILKPWSCRKSDAWLNLYRSLQKTREKSADKWFLQECQFSHRRNPLNLTPFHVYWTDEAQHHTASLICICRLSSRRELLCAPNLDRTCVSLMSRVLLFAIAVKALCPRAKKTYAQIINKN